MRGMVFFVREMMLLKQCSQAVVCARRRMRKSRVSCTLCIACRTETSAKLNEK